MPGRPQLLEIALTTPVLVGQQVRIGIPERSLLTSALLVYLVPLFFLLGLAWSARRLPISPTRNRTGEPR